MSLTSGGKRKPLSAKENQKQERHQAEEQERYKKDNHTLTLQVRAQFSGHSVAHGHVVISGMLR